MTASNVAKNVEPRTGFPTVRMENGQLVYEYPARPGSSTPFRTAAAGPAGTVTRFGVSFFATSAQLAAKLGLASIFDVQIKAGDRGIFLDAMAFSPDYFEPATPAGEPLYGVRRACGVRIALKVSAFKVDVGVSLPALTAQAQLSSDSVYYEAQAVGLDRDLFTQFLGGVPSSGPLNEASMKALDQLLREKLPGYLLNPETQLSLTDIVVAPRDRAAADEVNVARAVNLAMRRIVQRKSLRDTLTEIEGDDELRSVVDRTVVTFVYAVTAGLSDPDSSQKPSDRAVQSARQWLDVW